MPSTRSVRRLSGRWPPHEATEEVPIEFRSVTPGPPLRPRRRWRRHRRLIADKEVFEVSIEEAIPDEIVADFADTAREGGSNYWCDELFCLRSPDRPLTYFGEKLAAGAWYAAAEVRRRPPPARLASNRSRTNAGGHQQGGGALRPTNRRVPRAARRRRGGRRVPVRDPRRGRLRLATERGMCVCGSGSTGSVIR
jgi:hypothetical protein